MNLKIKIAFIIISAFFMSSCSNLDIALKSGVVQTETAEIEFQKFEQVENSNPLIPRYTHETGAKEKPPLYILWGLVIAFLSIVLFFNGNTSDKLKKETDRVSHIKSKKKVYRTNHIKSKKEVEKIPSESGYIDPLYNKSDSLTLPTIQVPILLKKGERGLAKAISKLSETRARRVNQSVFGGKRGKKSSFYGGSVGTSKSHQELTVLDKGVIYLTNKRLVFIGDKTNRDIKLDKIISLDDKDRWFSNDQIVVSSTGKSKQMYFSMSDMAEFKGKIEGAIDEL
jgi:hypothetical protein